VTGFGRGCSEWERGFPTDGMLNEIRLYSRSGSCSAGQGGLPPASQGLVLAEGASEEVE